MLLVIGSMALAADLFPADRQIAQAVDHYIDGGTQSAAIKPVATADDATLVRRLTLDLAGGFPRPPRLGPSSNRPTPTSESGWSTG